MEAAPRAGKFWHTLQLQGMEGAVIRSRLVLHTA